MTLAITRRRLVQGALGAAIAGCGPAPDGAPDAAEPDARSACPDPFAGGERVGLAAFVSERRQPFGELFGAGLDGRLYTDLAALAADAMVVPNERFYVRTRTPGRLDLADPERVRRGLGDGTGRFTTAPGLSTLAGGQTFDLIDLNGDGRPDIVGGDPSGTAVVVAHCTP